MLEAGDAVAGTGLAGLIAEKRKVAYGKTYKVKDDADGVNALAEAIIEYIVENTEVIVTDVTTGDDTAPGTIS